LWNQVAEFDRSYMIYYRSAVVSISLSCITDVEESHDIEIN